MGTIKFTPSNEMGTREWFAANLNKFDYSIIKSQSGYPDYVLEDGNGQQVKAEIEYTSDNFIAHGHNPDKCDLVVCWSHTQEVTLPVLELSTGILHKANDPATSPRLFKRENVIKETGLNKKTFRQALLKCKGKAEIFILAFIKDFTARETYLDLIKRQRIELLKANDDLIYALQDNGSNCNIIHPYDLFGLIATEHARLDFGNLKFLQLANGSINEIEIMLGESMRELHT